MYTVYKAKNFIQNESIPGERTRKPLYNAINNNFLQFFRALEAFNQALKLSPSGWAGKATTLGNRAAAYMMADR